MSWNGTTPAPRRSGCVATVRSKADRSSPPATAVGPPIACAVPVHASPLRAGQRREPVQSPSSLNPTSPAAGEGRGSGFDHHTAFTSEGIVNEIIVGVDGSEDRPARRPTPQRRWPPCTTGHCTSSRRCPATRYPRRSKVEGPASALRFGPASPEEQLKALCGGAEDDIADHSRGGDEAIPPSGLCEEAVRLARVDDRRRQQACSGGSQSPRIRSQGDVAKQAPCNVFIVHTRPSV